MGKYYFFHKKSLKYSKNCPIYLTSKADEHYMFTLYDKVIPIHPHNGEGYCNYYREAGKCEPDER